jgi:hypothetical protein
MALEVYRRKRRCGRCKQPGREVMIKTEENMEKLMNVLKIDRHSGTE